MISLLLEVKFHLRIVTEREESNLCVVRSNCQAVDNVHGEFLKKAPRLAGTSAVTDTRRTVDDNCKIQLFATS